MNKKSSYASFLRDVSHNGIFRKKDLLSTSLDTLVDVVPVPVYSNTALKGIVVKNVVADFVGFTSPLY
jgi:hypothetical protein